MLLVPPWKKNCQSCRRLRKELAWPRFCQCLGALSGTFPLSVPKNSKRKKSLRFQVAQENRKFCCRLRRKSPENRQKIAAFVGRNKESQCFRFFKIAAFSVKVIVWTLFEYALLCPPPPPPSKRTTKFIFYAVCKGGADALDVWVFGALRSGPPFQGLRSWREIKIQNASCQMGDREVTGR